MKIREIRLWVFVFGLLSLIAVYLYFQSQSNREQLEAQSLKAISLSKLSLLETFNNYQDRLEGYFIRNMVRSIEGEESPAGQLAGLLDKNHPFEVLKLSQLSQDRVNEFYRGLEANIVFRDGQACLEVAGLWVDFEPYLQDESVSLQSSLINSKIARTYAFQEETHPLIFESLHVIPFEDLMKFNQQNRFFDEIYILDSLGKVIFPESSRGLELLDHEGIKKGSFEEDKGFSSSNRGDQHLELKIGTVEYDGFLTSLQMAGQPLHLLGVKESSQFHKVAYRIDFNLLSLLLIALTLVFISIPVLSIFSMGEGDILTKSRVVGLGFSLIMFMLILGFSVAFFQNQQTAKHPFLKVNDEESEIQQIEGEFITEITYLLEKLNHPEVENEFLVKNFRLPVYEYLTFSIEKSTLGDVSTFVFAGSNPKKIKFSDRPVVSIPNRDYVRAVNAKGPGHAFISSQFSKASGKLEGVISIGEGMKGKAVTFAIDSLSPELSNRHRYFLFKPGGEVLLKSDKVNIPVSQLQDALGGSKWEEIRSLVENNPEPGNRDFWEVPVHVNGYGYVAILKKLDLSSFDAPIWGLYLVDQHLQNTLHALTALEALLILLTYFVVLIILTVFHRLTNPRNIYLKVKPFEFEWYRPSLGKRDAFLFANYLMFVFIILFALAYLFLSLNFFMSLLWAIIFSYVSSICNYVLIHGMNVRREGVKVANFLGPALFIALLAMAAQLIFVFGTSQGIIIVFTIALLILLIGFIFLCAYMSGFNKFLKLSPDIENPSTLLEKAHLRLTRFWANFTRLPVEKRIYALNFLLWVFILGFIPGYIIHRHVFHQENYLWQETMSPPHEGSQRVINENGFYHELIQIHEKVRRNNFVKVISRDEQVHDFITASFEAVKRSFFEGRIPLQGNLEGNSRSFVGLVADKFGRVPFLVASVALTLLLLFHLLLRVSDRVFLIDYLFSHERYQLPKAAKQLKRYFIVCLDHLVARNWVFDQFNISENKMRCIDLAKGETPPHHEEKDEASMLISNFHTIAGGSELDILIQSDESKYYDKVFITSGKSILDILKGVEEKNKAHVAEQLKCFLFLTVPLHYKASRMKVPDLYGYFKNDNLELGKLIDDEGLSKLNREISFGHKPEALSALIKATLEGEGRGLVNARERFEKAILTIQRYNKSYFYSIWSLLNFKERKMVYHFAAEGFVNYTNREMLAQLMQKGLIRLSHGKDKLELFSESFKNFVLQNITADELRLFRREERDTGNAATIKGAVISFVFIAVALLSLFDPSLVDKTVAYLSAAIGVMGTLYSFSQKLLGKLWGKKES